MREIEVPVEICRENACLPSYHNLRDAGMVGGPGETVIIPTGLKFAIPEGYEIQVRPRSGITFRTPLRVSNSPGTIDSGYRDELGIIMTNTSEPAAGRNEGEYYTPDSRGNKKGIYRVSKGDRIAQLVLQEVPRMRLKVVRSVAEIGDNRGGGFGSTGVK